MHFSELWKHSSHEYITHEVSAKTQETQLGTKQLDFPVWSNFQISTDSLKVMQLPKQIKYHKHFQSK